MKKSHWFFGQLRPPSYLVCVLLLVCLVLPGSTAAAAKQDSSLYLPLLQAGFRYTTNPSWKILTLIFHNTDFSYSDNAGAPHRLVASMTEQEKQRAEQKATLFAINDMPRLNSGQMIPEITIRHISTPLTELSPQPCNDYAPTAWDLGVYLESDYDAVIVIWDATGTDVNTGAPGSIAGCAYSWDMGMSQAYLTIDSSWLYANDRNVFKHEFGHSLLFYYNASGTAPKPSVDNHINDNDRRYVNCKTGQPYILQDETDDAPIPNSIYNNDSGFTHDYYSGLTAEAGTPTNCLGIHGPAWASGGPVTGPGNVSRTVELPEKQFVGAPVPYPKPPGMR